MRWIRLLTTLAISRFRSKLRINEPSIMTFRVWVTDIDVSIMNHAAMMSVMEMGRIDFMVRTGFFKLAQRNKWYFPSSNIQVQFFRPLKMFQKATVVTKVFNISDKWIYLEQKILRGEKLIACCVVKSTVKKGRQQLNITDIVQQLNLGMPPRDGNELIACLEAGNQLMNERITDS
jgi:acyl-CoA thioesterase FadM